MADSGILVCQNAICTCTMAGGMMAPLNVVTQSKYYVNDSEGAQKKIATDMEISPASLNFGVCKPGTLAATPCVANLKWSQFYEKVVLSNGGKVLLDSSIAQCSTAGGTVTIIMHGQIPGVGVSSINSGNGAVQAQINNAGDFNAVKSNVNSSAECTMGGNSIVMVESTEINDLSYEPCKYTAIQITERNRSTTIFNEKKLNVEITPFEIVAGPEQDKKTINFAIDNYNTDKCTRSDDAHTSQVIYVVDDSNKETVIDISGGTASFDALFPMADSKSIQLQYFWPASIKPIGFKLLFDTCRHIIPVKILIYPDIRWEIEFKWNYSKNFAFKYNNELKTFSLDKDDSTSSSTAKDNSTNAILKTNSNTAVVTQSTTTDSTKNNQPTNHSFASKIKSIAQSFGLSLKAVWDNNSKDAEMGEEIIQKIRDLLVSFIEIKSLIDNIINAVEENSPLTFNISQPSIAASIGWYLEESTIDPINKVATIVEIKASSLPLIEADVAIDLIQLGANLASPALAKIIDFIRDKLSNNVNAAFTLTLKGEIDVDGDVTINTLHPNLTIGNIASNQTVTVDLLLSATASGSIYVMGQDAILEGEASIDGIASISAKLELGVDNSGVYFLPSGVFNGLKVTFVLKGSVRFGVLKKGFDKNPDDMVIFNSTEFPGTKKYFTL